MTRHGDTAGTVRIPVAVLVERRPGVTRWAEEVWRPVEVVGQVSRSSGGTTSCRCA